MTKSTPHVMLRRQLLRSALLIVLCVHSGCTTPAPQAQRFLKHPEFTAAAQAAPHFTRDILHALADAESRNP
jgi:hypothetical protein